jgi:hypothetical protein
MTTWWQLVVRRPVFRRLWLAECVSLAGDWISYVAVTSMAAEQGGQRGAFAVAGVLVAHNLPHVALAGWAGVLADRFDRRRMLLSIHTAQFLVTLLMAAAATRGTVAWVSALVVVRASIGALTAPARAGALRRSVPEAELLEANALSGATWSAMFAVGMAIGGWVSAFGTVTALLVDAGTFATATALIFTIPPMPTAGPSAAPPRLFDAAAWAWPRPAVRMAIGSKAPISLGTGAAMVTLALSADQHPYLGSAALTYGALQSFRGVGTGIGPIIASAALRRGVAPRSAVRFVSWLSFLSMAAFGVVAGSPWGLAVALVWGLGSGTNWVLASASLQKLAPDGQIGRLAALDWVLLTIGTCVGATASAAAITLTGDIRWGALCGALLGATAWTALAMSSAHDTNVTGRDEA